MFVIAAQIWLLLPERITTYTAACPTGTFPTRGPVFDSFTVDQAEPMFKASV